MVPNVFARMDGVRMGVTSMEVPIFTRSVTAATADRTVSGSSHAVR